VSEPPGEAQLRALSRRFDEVERRLRALIAHAPSADRRGLLGEALKLLVELRREDFRGPVTAAYLAALREAGGGARARTVRDLAASLHLKLDRAIQMTEASVRKAIKTATADNIDETVAAGVVAHEDARGTRWALGSWATMNTETIGRQATTRGVIDAVGRKGTVTVEVGECGFCAQFEGEQPADEASLPPYHPNCSCVASAA
jgi:hypothetical protein